MRACVHQAHPKFSFYFLTLVECSPPWKSLENKDHFEKQPTQWGKSEGRGSTRAHPTAGDAPHGPDGG